MVVQTPTPSKMTVVEIRHPGGPEVLVPAQRPVPKPAADEVLIRVFAAGVNGPDVLQRKGNYDPPPGASDIPGLEVSGEVVALGSAVTRHKVGDRVVALLPGGGYAEYAVAHELLTASVPDGLTMVEAAGLLETFMTVWSNMFVRGRFQAGETILIHGGASGIGSTAIMLARHFRASKIMTTVSSQFQRDFVLERGADVPIIYHDEDFVAAVKDATQGYGADVILDIIAGDYVARNFEAAALNGRIVQISTLKGPAENISFSPLVRKRLTHIGSTLRSRTIPEKAELLDDLIGNVFPIIREGAVKPYLFRTFPLDDARGAHELLGSRQHVGKVILVTPAGEAAAPDGRTRTP